MENTASLYIEERIAIREDGQIKMLSRAEWNERYPDREPVTLPAGAYDDGEVYWANITHNLTRMASEAGLYEPLWRPEEIDIETAKQLTEPLKKGLALLESNPGRFEQFNPSNGWGNYEGLVSFVRNYLRACVDYPDATIRVSR